ncbi:MAG: glutaredoxin [Saprospiraceae bacterium]|nr:glutaredoxin [Bacteroidia bacterium]MBT8228737.1 glutaredoxin [Bacteroidia bacterium]NNF22271.1 glutaredoxin [Saprospiraceae bacterium]NNK90121.1 glutaredoxin [Saprospiraceae bacterium]
MKTHQREILIYYNPNKSGDRKTVAHAQGTGFKIRTYHHSQAPSTTTSWKTILNSLQMHPKELLNKADPYYQNNLRGKEFDDEDWLNVLKKNPNLIKSPIAISGNRAIICRTPTDIYKL